MYIPFNKGLHFNPPFPVMHLELPSVEDASHVEHESDSQSMLLYMQIPIALCVIGIIFGLWKYQQGQKKGVTIEENLILEGENETLWEDLTEMNDER